MDRAAVAEAIITLTAELVAMDPSEINEDQSFIDDLEADSLDLAEMALQAEQELGVKIQKEDFADIKTVGDVIDYIHSRQS